MGFRFAVEKQDWIVKQTQLLSTSKPAIIYDETNGFDTRFHKITIKRHIKSIIQTQKKDNQVTILIPEHENIQSLKTQNNIKSVITEVLRTEAKKYLIPRLFELAKIHGFTFNNIYIKNLKSRWGSCSIQNNINLNLHLMRLPEYLSDFIILHELCHTIHRNHGIHFHALLNKIAGDEKPLNKELKKYSSQL